MTRDNIFRRHREETLARQAAEAAAGEPLPLVAAEGPRADGMGGIIRTDAATNEAKLMLVKLTSDRAALKTYQSGELRAKAKADLLPDYQDWLDGLIADPEALPVGERNDVLFYAMIWHLDCREIARALELAELVLARKVEVPSSSFKRTPGCLIAEEVAERAFDALRADAAYFDQDWIAQAMLLTEAEDMPDEARAKLFKASALFDERKIDALEAAGGPQADGSAGAYAALIFSAKASAVRALELNSGCGVKKLLEKLDRLAKKIEPISSNQVSVAGATPATGNPS
jgi:Phage small terminase subunit